MPKVNEYQGIQFAGFENGLNLHADSSRLEPSELSLADNVRLGPRGEVQLRSGYSRRDNNIPAIIRGLAAWRNPNGTDYIVVVDENSQVWYDQWANTNYELGPTIDPGTTLQTFGVGFASAKNLLYISSKNSPVQGFTGSSFFLKPEVPSAKHLIYRHNRLFAINTLANDSRVAYSALGDPDAFGTDDWIDVDPEDGYEINAATVFGDDLMLFKDFAIWKLSGRTPSSFSLYRIDNERGCVSPYSVQQLRGLLMFFDRSTGIWSFDGASLELISEPINDYILKGQDYELAYKAAAYIAEDRYYLTIPWEGGGNRTFVYFADTGGWTEYTDGFTVGAESHQLRFVGLFTPGLFIANATSQLHPPSIVPIVAKWRTGWQLLGGPGVKARMRRLEATVKSNEGSTGTIRMYRDYDDTTPYITRTFDGGATVYAAIDADERRVALDGWGNRVHAVMFEFETADLPFQMNQFTLFYTGGPDIRGER